MAASQKYEQLIVEQREKLFIIKFNRIAKKNALDREAYRDIMHALNAATNDNTITMIALTGVGDYFTSGTDLTQFQRYTNVSEFFKSANYVLLSFIKAIIYCPKPIVAVVNGPCLGIGFTLCALCDVVYCTDNAYFQAPFTKLGICPEAGSSFLFPMTLGRAKATELLLFGTKLNAQQALAFNFVADIFRFEDLELKLWIQLQQYAELPTQSLLITKRLLRTEERQYLFKAVQLELAELTKLRFSDVYVNAIESFVRKSKNKSNL